jgi:hypothetical protein
MSDLNSNKHVLSNGWSGLTRSERRSSEAYVWGAERYAHTSRRVGDVRIALMRLATRKNMQPPLQQQEIRLHQRDAEIRERLGAKGVELLVLHEQAAVANQEAMLRLRNEDNRINVQLTTVEGV